MTRPQPLDSLEVSPAELAQWMLDKPDLVLLDVRQDEERALAELLDSRVRYAPMSEIVRLRTHAMPDELIDRDRPTVVFCHVGERSLQIVHWMRHQGWSQVYSLAGGIDAYARICDPRINRY